MVLLDFHFQIEHPTNKNLFLIHQHMINFHLHLLNDIECFEDLKQLLSRANGQLRLYVRDCNTGNYVWTSSTHFRGRLAGQFVRSSVGEEAEPAEEEGFFEDDFQPGDAGDVEELAEDGAGGESL